MGMGGQAAPEPAALTAQGQQEGQLLDRPVATQAGPVGGSSSSSWLGHDAAIFGISNSSSSAGRELELPVAQLQGAAGKPPGELQPAAGRPGSSTNASHLQGSSCSVTHISVPDITVRAADGADRSSHHHHQQQQRLSLEWLRELGVEDVRAFFSGRYSKYFCAYLSDVLAASNRTGDMPVRLLAAGVTGLGRKSVACVSLLALGMRDFPVDVNVGRISARLGWIPLQSPDALEDLERYPAEPEVHAYLLDRLTRVADMAQLYELHYLAITLGKEAPAWSQKDPEDERSELPSTELPQQEEDKEEDKEEGEQPQRSARAVGRSSTHDSNTHDSNAKVASSSWNKLFQQLLVNDDKCKLPEAAAAFGLLDTPLLELLQLPADFLPPAAPGAPQQPLLLFVEVPKGCRAGQFLDVPAAGGQSAQCKDCPKGKWCQGALQNATDCPANMDTLNTRARRITACGGLNREKEKRKEKNVLD
eukprot:gene5834-6075_t